MPSTTVRRELEEDRRARHGPPAARQQDPRSAADKAADGRSAGDKAKARQILDGARSAFHELGYEGASVDEIARRARVSKPTVYSHFGDKRAVFTAFMRRACEEQARRIFEVEVVEAGGVEPALRRVARHYVAFLHSPFAQDIFRSVVAEARRFPEIGRVFLESGPGLGARRLAGLLAQGVAQGELLIDDLDLAAHQLIELCKADLFYQRLLTEAPPPAEAEIARVADQAVTTFLKAYGRTARRSRKPGTGKGRRRTGTQQGGADRTGASR